MNARIETFRVDASALAVNRRDVELALGYAETAVPEYLPEMIDEALDRARPLLDVQCGFSIFTGTDVEIASPRVRIRNVEFATGAIIAKRLRHSISVALFAATIGKAVEHQSKQLMAEGDMMGGFVYDTIGSVYAEAAADCIERAINTAADTTSERITNRYSPGYCDWAVSEQHQLFSLVPPAWCGITLTRSALMLPIKSVSGIIGIGPSVKREEYQCSICDMNDCIRKKYVGAHTRS